MHVAATGPSGTKTIMARICNILVVEDDDAVRELLGDILEHQGYEFTLVMNGNAMRQALEREQFDVAIIDISLRGGEDGFALAEIASANGCTVILTTGDPHQRLRLEASGRSHLFKPFRVQQMTDLVDEVLNEAGILCEKRGGCDDAATRAAA
jgi:two-component system OmpR family response regulator